MDMRYFYVCVFIYIYAYYAILYHCGCPQTCRLHVSGTRTPANAAVQASRTNSEKYDAVACSHYVSTAAPMLTTLVVLPVNTVFATSGSKSSRRCRST